jgi:hypothetical protein
VGKRPKTEKIDVVGEVEVVRGVKSSQVKRGGQLRLRFRGGDSRFEIRDSKLTFKTLLVLAQL